MESAPFRRAASVYAATPLCVVWVSIDHRNGKAQFCSKEHSDLAWVASNPERVLANARRHQWSDTGRAYRQTYQREHLAERRQWARENRRRASERYRAYWKSWAEANQEVLGFAARTRRSRKRNNGGGPWIGVSLRDWQRLVRRYRGCCAYCGVLASPVSMDHVIPLVKGGRHSIGNVLPACSYCNSTKHAMLLSVWRHRNGGGQGAPVGWRVASQVVRGERNGNARITADEVREMRRRNSDGERQVSLAKDYGITQATVSNIVLRKTWKHIE